MSFCSEHNDESNNVNRRSIIKKHNRGFYNKMGKNTKLKILYEIAVSREEWCAKYLQAHSV